MMSGIRGRDTKPELIVRSYLHKAGLRFRLRSKLPGKPDLVFPRFRTAVFVHGCFWHRHVGCRYTAVPATNRAFWNAKFSANVRRDKKVARLLQGLGWHVVVVWECQLSPPELHSLKREILRGGKGRR